jgi:hypothetical protein
MHRIGWRRVSSRISQSNWRTEDAPLTINFLNNYLRNTILRVTSDIFIQYVKPPSNENIVWFGIKFEHCSPCYSPGPYWSLILHVYRLEPFLHCSKYGLSQGQNYLSFSFFLLVLFRLIFRPACEARFPCMVRSAEWLIFAAYLLGLRPWKHWLYVLRNRG